MITSKETCFKYFRNQIADKNYSVKDLKKKVEQIFQKLKGHKE